jgi:hypothetical protein
VAGLGPAAIEVVAAATVGRGGRFETRRGQLRYRPGGAEPNMLLFSRSGVPYRARPGYDPAYEPDLPRYPERRSTPEVFTALRLHRRGPLDLHADLMPLLYADMRDAAAECARRTGAPYVDPVAALHPAAQGDPLSHAGASHRWWRVQLAADLADAARGVTGSPLEAGLQVLRELWDTVRRTAATPDPELDRVVARAVAGPPMRRHAELLALADAGLLRVPLGPDPSVTPTESGWRLASRALRTPIVLTAAWLCPSTP